MVCDDVFEAKKYKYINWKRIKNNSNLSNQDSIYSMPQAVFNPCCGYDPSLPKNVIVTDWPWQSEAEIDQINTTNLFIKEITCQTLEDIKKRKEQREFEEKMRQPKRVHRKKEMQIEYSEEQFNIYIDIAAIRSE
jgi:hypothetical protein